MPGACRAALEAAARAQAPAAAPERTEPGESGPAVRWQLPFVVAFFVGGGGGGLKREMGLEVVGFILVSVLVTRKWFHLGLFLFCTGLG